MGLSTTSLGTIGDKDDNIEVVYNTWDPRHPATHAPFHLFALFVVIDTSSCRGGQCNAVTLTQRTHMLTVRRLIHREERQSSVEVEKARPWPMPSR